MLLLGVVQAQAFETAAAGSYDLLQTEILTGSQASVTFSDLGDYAGTYQHLQVRASYKGVTANTESVRMRINGDTGSNYSIHGLLGDGSSVSSFGLANTVWMTIGDSKNTADAYAAAVIDLLDSFETSKYPTIKVLSGTSEAVTRIDLASGSRRNTEALSSISFFMNSGSDLAAKTRFSLYGLKASV